MDISPECLAPDACRRCGKSHLVVKASGFLCVEAQRHVTWYGHSCRDSNGHLPGRSGGRCPRYLSMSWLNLHLSPKEQLLRVKWKQRPSFPGIVLSLFSCTMWSGITDVRNRDSARSADGFAEPYFASRLALACYAFACRCADFINSLPW